MDLLDVIFNELYGLSQRDKALSSPTPPLIDKVCSNIITFICTSIHRKEFILPIIQCCCKFLVIYVHTYISACMIVNILDTQSSSQLCDVVSFFAAGEDHYFSSRSGSCSSSADGLQGRSWGVCMESCL
jgi:hypothetical protein